MKRLTLPLACLALAFPASLSARDFPSGDDFDALDATGEGAVTDAEVLEYHVAELKRAFAALDEDGDEALRKTELGEPRETSSGPRFSIPRIITVKPERKLHPSKVTAGTRGPAGPMSRRISR